MANQKTPGVSIQEIPKLPASVAEVATAVPAFIGYTENIGGTAQSLLLVPKRITSLLEYEETFGGPDLEQFDITLTDASTSSGAIARTIDVAKTTSGIEYNMYYSLQMFFANGGGTCYIVPVGDYSSTVEAVDFKAGVAALEKIDEVTLLVFPDAVSLSSTDYGDVVGTALGQCAKLQDRFVIADVPEAAALTNSKLDVAKVESYRTDLGINNLKYGATYMPYIKTTLTYGINETTSTVVSHAVAATNDDDLQNMSLADLKAAYPSAYRSILAEINKLRVTLPPSGSIAGIYARVDADRGVWKAPANVSINGVSGPDLLITNEQQELLNVDANAGKSINAIRSFTGKGTLVWGSRTLAGNDNEWRYVPVRRFFNFAEESIKKATEFVVFEPNDANTWVRVKAMIENFLTTQWRQGALAGAKKEDAFFVNVGLGTTMTALDILEGRLNIEIGMAVVRPAEFIILKFSHKLQES